MPEAFLLVIVVVSLAFDFINGFHDAANAIATSVLTRALSMKNAVLMAAVLNFFGALVSERVATTIGKGIVDPSNVTAVVILSGILGAIIWSLICWWFGLPTSQSHALIGGVVGAVIAANTGLSFTAGQLVFSSNLGVFNAAGLTKIILALVISPSVGFVFGYMFMVVLMWTFRHTRPSILNRVFRRLQVLSAAFMAFSHGGNDAQKTMGVITMTLVSAGVLKSFHIPTWVKLLCALAMGLGTAAGGWRIIKTIGRKVMELKPVHGFAAETSAALVIQTCTHIGAPISTTHVISSTIMGVGSSRRLSGVRWRVAGQIILAWVLTLPVSALLSALTYWALSLFA